MTEQKPCIFCITDSSVGSWDVEPERVLHSYKNWWLILRPQENRERTKIASGMLVSKRHIEIPTMMSDEEATELIRSVKDAAQRLCDAAGVTYTDQETVGFNQGVEAGQSQMHAHVHILPVAEEDPAEMKVRGGMGGAFEALRIVRIPRP